MAKMKKLYRGDFNWYGETITMYRQAPSHKAAFNLFIFVVAKMVDRSTSSVRQYFTQSKDNYQIIKE